MSHQLRTAAPADEPADQNDTWRAFGTAVLTFHHRVWMTAMCRCGRTIIECDVMAQARQHGLLPPLK